MSLLVARSAPPLRMDRCASVQRQGERSAIGPRHGTCARNCTSQPGCADHSSSSSHVIRCICSRRFDVKRMRTRVIAHVQCSSGSGSCLPRILAGMCHAAVVISRQNVKIGRHHILVAPTAHEKSRARCVPADAADELRGPDQHCRHVGTTSGWPPQIHPVGHAMQCTAQCETGGQAILSPQSGASCAEPVATDVVLPIR